MISPDLVFISLSSALTCCLLLAMLALYIYERPLFSVMCVVCATFAVLIIGAFYLQEKMIWVLGLIAAAAAVVLMTIFVRSIIDLFGGERK